MKKEEFLDIFPNPQEFIHYFTVVGKINRTLSIASQMFYINEIHFIGSMPKEKIAEHEEL